jgi:hypothetical protein
LSSSALVIADFASQTLSTLTSAAATLPASGA